INILKIVDLITQTGASKQLLLFSKQAFYLSPCTSIKRLLSNGRGIKSLLLVWSFLLVLLTPLSLGFCYLFGLVNVDLKWSRFSVSSQPWSQSSLNGIDILCSNFLCLMCQVRLDQHTHIEPV